MKRKLLGVTLPKKTNNAQELLLPTSNRQHFSQILKLPVSSIANEGAPRAAVSCRVAEAKRKSGPIFRAYNTNDISSLNESHVKICQ